MPEQYLEGLQGVGAARDAALSIHIAEDAEHDDGVGVSEHVEVAVHTGAQTCVPEDSLDAAPGKRSAPSADPDFRSPLTISQKMPPITFDVPPGTVNKLERNP